MHGVELDRLARRRTARRRIVAEQLGRHALERVGACRIRRREAAPIGIVHGRFVVDDQNSHCALPLARRQRTRRPNVLAEA